MPNIRTNASLALKHTTLFSSLGLFLFIAPAANAAPAVTLSASPSSIAAGTSSTITWSVNDGSSCKFTSGTGSPGRTALAANGSFNTPVLNASSIFTLSCTGTGGVKTLSKTVTVNSGRACSSSGATGAIELSNVASRLSGIAPLSIFFDATGTTATATAQPFHELEYRWDFGDEKGSPVSGTTWNTGSRANTSSRNLATGPVAAHVFETPGTYTVALTVTDGTHSASNRCIQIEVEDAESAFSGSKTICVAATDVPVAGADGCPAGATTAQQSSFPAAISNYAKTGKRVLFKRGDTFTAATEARITENGPGTVGSYGTGALPLIQMTGSPQENTPVLSFSSVYTPKFSDWRIMDLMFDGMNGAHNMGIGIGSSSGGVNQITVLRVWARNMTTSYGFGGDLINYWNSHGSSGHTIDQVSIVDSTSTAGANSNTSCYNAGNRIAFMGNNIDGGGIAKGSHVTRFPFLSKAVISNNNLSRPGFDRHTIKLHAPYWNATTGVFDPTATAPASSGPDSTNYSAALNGDGYSKQIVISDNKITDHANPWSVTVGPQDSGKDERVRDVIIERNWFVATPTSQSLVALWAADTTVRNNIFAAGASNASGVMVGHRGIEPPSTNVRIFNNSFFSAYGSSSNPVIPFQIGSTTTNTTAKNNLAYAPNSNNALMFDGAGKSGFIASSNTTKVQLHGTNPKFTSSTPLNPADFRPAKGSYAIDKGELVPVWSDFFLQRRPRGSSDIGAIEVP
ncbi:MAG: PKD domain-containing protein [Gammaproteobacteria bacterium]|nr:PKD domain-containing protein [Gammaproteobacteria bacterium]MBU1483049.1 PKD domain-containing protein [Gammaproteobacteria bacterium]